MNPFTLGVLRFNEDILTSGSFYIACIFAQPLRRNNFAGEVSFLDCSLGKSTQSPKLYNYKKKEKEVITTHSQVVGISSFEQLKAVSFGWKLSCSQCCFNCSHTPYRAHLPSWRGIAHKPTFQLWKAKEWWRFSHPVVSDSYNPWTAAHQPPLSMGFFRQEYWSGCHVLFRWIFQTQGSNSRSPALQAVSVPTEPPGKPKRVGCSLKEHTKAFIKWSKDQRL